MTVPLRLSASVVLLLALVVVRPASADPAADPVPPPPVDYCIRQCSDILPPGQNGNATFTDLLLFKGLGIRPPHVSDTKAPYENLVWNYRGITDDKLGPYFDVLKVPAATTYPATADCAAGNQFCSDQIIHQPLGGITQDKTQWVNRPTYQQVVEFPAHRGDDVSDVARRKVATASSYERGVVRELPGVEGGGW